MLIRVLGPITVRSGDRDTTIAATKPRHLIALLALSANDLVTTEALIDGLWPVDPPRTARSALQVHMGAMRSILEPERSGRDEGSYVRTESDGYRLCVEEDQLDRLRFEGGIDRARREAGRGRSPDARRHLEEALGLWRGTPFADGPEAVGPTRTWLQERRLEAEDLWYGLALDDGLHLDVVAELTRSVAREPERGPRVGLLMLALHRAGRRTDALALFQRHRQRMVDVHGLQPAAELQELDRRITADDPTLGGTKIFAPSRRHDSKPVDDKQQSALVDLMSSPMLISVTGAPGSRLTDLVSRAAQRAGRPSVRAISEGASLRTVLADALDLADKPFLPRAQQIQSALPDGAVVVTGRLADDDLSFARSLVDLGHSVISCGTVAQLAADATVHIAPLRVPPVGASPAEVLSAPAVQRLVVAAGLAAEDLTDEEIGLLARRARASDGIPLALDLAGRRLRLLGWDSGTADEIGRTDHGDVLAREIDRALHDLDASSLLLVDLLSYASTGLRFEIIREALDLDAVEATAAAADCCARGLAVTEVQDGVRRCRLLRPVAASRRQALEDSERPDDLRDRYGAALARDLATQARRLMGPDMMEALALLRRERPEHRMALAWLEGQPDALLHVEVNAELVFAWMLLGALEEGQGWAERAAGRSDAPEPLRASCHATAAFSAWWRGDYPSVVRNLEAAEQLDVPEDDVLMAVVRGSVAWAGGDLDGAEAAIGVAYERQSTVPHGRRETTPEHALLAAVAGNIAWYRGDPHGGADRYRRCREIGGQRSNPFIRGIGLRGESVCMALLGHDDRAAALVAEGRAMALAQGDAQSLGQAAVFGAMVAAIDQRWSDGAAGAIDGLRHAEAAGDLFGTLLGVSTVAACWWELGRQSDAVTVATWVDMITAMTGVPLPPEQRRHIGAIIAPDGGRLSPTERTEAATRGRELPPDGVVRWILER